MMQGDSQGWRVGAASTVLRTDGAVRDVENGPSGRSDGPSDDALDASSAIARTGWCCR